MDLLADPESALGCSFSILQKTEFHAEVIKIPRNHCHFPRGITVIFPPEFSICFLKFSLPSPLNVI
jgi:hypothetical protein